MPVTLLEWTRKKSQERRGNWKREREERRVSEMMGGWVVMEETAPQILTNATKPMKAY